MRFWKLLNIYSNINNCDCIFEELKISFFHMEMIAEIFRISLSQIFFVIMFYKWTYIHKYTFFLYYNENNDFLL